MHITDTRLTLSSQHSSESQSIRSTLIVPMNTEVPAQVSASEFDAMFQESLKQTKQLKTLAEAQPISLSSIKSETYAQESLLTALLEMLLGQRSEFSAIDLTGLPSTTAAQERAPQWRYVEAEQISESESCQFNASGKICLADGSERQFDVSYAMQRSEETTRLVAGQAVFQDPLVLDFGAPQTSLAANTVAFDLDADGKTEAMHLPGKDSAVLFYDRNRNGVADNGRELFGPSTGSGFGELARLDADGNGWLDSADSAFADLKLWRSDGTRTQSLTEAGVGAISTANASTPFTLKNQGEIVGMQRSSGVWLGEQGGAGSVRQVDVAVSRKA